MQTPYPGDALIPNPEMHYNHSILIRAPPSTIYPWVLQLGKSRGGWPLPASWERFLPQSMHAARTINPEWQNLSVGDRVPDYGFGDEDDDYFDVAEVIRDRALVYRSERYGTVFSWAILLRELPSLQSQSQSQSHQQDESPGVVETEVRLRFRGRIQRTGWQRWVLVTGGGFMDWLTTWPMLRGLKERAERAHHL